MSYKPYLRLGIIAGLIVSLTACSILNRGSRQKEALAEEERQGRITMVLDDQRLVADASLLSEIVTLPEAQPATEGWPQAGRQASKSVGHIKAGEDLSIAWRTSIGKGSDQRSAIATIPVASEDTIYVVDSRQRLTAVDASNGRTRWSIRLKSGNRRDKHGIGAGLGLEGDTLVVASGYGFVAALDANTGEEIWRRDTEAPMTGAPTIKDGRIFVSSNNNEVITMDLSDGTVIWSDQAIAESARVLGAPSPAAVEDIIVAPYSSGEIIAYLAANGRRLWSEALASGSQFTPISAINDIGARPILGGGFVFAANQSGVLTAIDGRTGNRVWQLPVGSTQAPALVGEYIFIAGVEGELACIKAGTGQVVWVKDMPRFKNVEKSRGRLSYAGPLIASERIIVISSLGELIAHDPQTGDEIGRLKLGDPVYIEPIAVQDKIIVLTDEGRLIAIR